MPRKPTEATQSPSKPLLDGQHESFARELAFGNCSKTEAYERAGFKNGNANAFKVSEKYGIPERVEWLKANTATEKTMGATEKRERLAWIARNDDSEPTVIIAAIKEDNVMAGHNKPTELLISGGLDVREAIKSLTHGGGPTA